MLEFLAESSPAEAVLWTLGSAIYAISCFFLYKQWKDSGDVYVSILDQDGGVNSRKRKNTVGTYTSLVYIAFFSILFLHQVTTLAESPTPVEKRPPTIMEFLKEKPVGGLQKPKETVKENAKIVQFYEQEECVTLPMQVPTTDAGRIHQFKCDEDSEPLVKIWGGDHCEGESTEWQRANGNNPSFLWKRNAAMAGNKFGDGSFTCEEADDETIVKVEMEYKLEMKKCDPKHPLCDADKEHVIVWECNCEGEKVGTKMIATQLKSCVLVRATVDMLMKSMDVWEDNGDAICREIIQTKTTRRRLNSKKLDAVMRSKRHFGPSGHKEMKFVDYGKFIPKETSVGDEETEVGVELGIGFDTKIFGSCSTSDLVHNFDIAKKARELGELIHKKVHAAYCGFGKLIRPDCEHAHAGHGYFLNKALDLAASAQCVVVDAAFSDCTSTDVGDVDKEINSHKKTVEKDSKKGIKTFSKACGRSDITAESELEVGEYPEYDFEEARIFEEQVGQSLLHPSKLGIAQKPFWNDWKNPVGQSWRCSKGYQGTIQTHRGEKNLNCEKRPCAAFPPLIIELGLGVAIFTNHYGIGAGIGQLGDGVTIPYWGRGWGVSPDYFSGWGEVYFETAATTGNFIGDGITFCAGVSHPFGSYDVGLELCKAHGRDGPTVKDHNAFGLSISIAVGIDSLLKQVNLGDKLEKFNWALGWMKKKKSHSLTQSAIKANNKIKKKVKIGLTDSIIGKTVKKVKDNTPSELKGGSLFEWIFGEMKGWQNIEMGETWEVVYPYSAWCTYGRQKTLFNI